MLHGFRLTCILQYTPQAEKSKHGERQGKTGNGGGNRLAFPPGL